MGESISVGHLSARRAWSDRITKYVIGLGGGAVIVAITLIFAYLLWDPKTPLKLRLIVRIQLIKY